jgi:hypothetical protein
MRYQAEGVPTIVMVTVTASRADGRERRFQALYHAAVETDNPHISSGLWRLNFLSVADDRL